MHMHVTCVHVCVSHSITLLHCCVRVCVTVGILMCNEDVHVSVCVCVCGFCLVQHRKPCRVNIEPFWIAPLAGCDV